VAAVYLQSTTRTELPQQKTAKCIMSDLDGYDYDLPSELIAQRPVARRADARLMVVTRQSGEIEHWHVRDLPKFLRAGDGLVLNDTRVVPARLQGYRVTTGGRWSGLFVSADARGLWQVLGKTRGKLRSGARIMLQDRAARDAFTLRLVADQGTGIWVAEPEATGSFVQLLEQVGRVPLPPYIRGGQMQPDDWTRYQTVFAETPGAIAAPTAGLHFTAELLAELTHAGVQLHHVTLHVGIGTFRPIAVEHLDAHQMHAEWCQISESTTQSLCACRAAGGRIVAVGTTSVRTLETASANGTLHAWDGETDLFIRPPHTFHAVDVLLTNFHLPRSTLLVLVHAFGGAHLMRRVYETAIAERYRFYSYGDAMLIV